MESELDMVIGLNNVEATLRDEKDRAAEEHGLAALQTTNNDYTTALKVWVEYTQFIAKTEYHGNFTNWCRHRLHSSTNVA